MDILLTQTTAVGAAAAAADLRRHGHHVEVCHPDGAEVCVALSGGRCPLDLGTIDAAVVVRSYATPNELPLERGAVCAAIRGVPLIVAGDPADNPYAPWATADEEGFAVARTVETVVGLPLVGLSSVATHALHKATARAGLAAHGRVEVRRRHGGVVAHLLGVEELTTAQRAMASVRVAAAIRAEDRWVRRIDVSLRRAAPRPAAGFLRDD